MMALISMSALFLAMMPQITLAQLDIDSDGDGIDDVCDN